MNSENNSLEIYENFRLPEMVEDADFTSEDLAEDRDGLQLNFQRIKIPPGGVLQFEMPGGEPTNPITERFITGVIIHNHASNAFWPEGSEDDEDATPLCSSFDGKTGFGEPGGDCQSCSGNQFGTGPKGKGKACKNMRVLYLLRDGDLLPIQIMLPPTSIKPFNDFYSAAFAFRNRASYGSVVTIGLIRKENGNTYSVATFKKEFDFTGEQLARVKAYAKTFKTQITAMNQQRAATAVSRADEVNNIGPGGYIDGDKEELPL